MKTENMEGTCEGGILSIIIIDGCFCLQHNESAETLQKIFRIFIIVKINYSAFTLSSLYRVHVVCLTTYQLASIYLKRHNILPNSTKRRLYYMWIRNRLYMREVLLKVYSTSEHFTQIYKIGCRLMFIFSCGIRTGFIA